MSTCLQVGVFALWLVSTTWAQSPADDLGLSQGYTSFHTTNFDLKLVTEAQVLASLQAAGGTFDFLPFGYLPERSGNGQYHWGDVTFRYRPVGSTAWISADSAAARAPVTVLSSGSNDTDNDTVLASSHLAPTLPAHSAAVVHITREWLQVDGDLGLSFTLTNAANNNTALELGSLGFPAEFNNIFTNYTAAETQEFCSLVDPYIGMHAGYLRVAPINGHGPALVVTPLGDTPLEAYRNLDEPYYDSTAYGSQVFEGLYEWQTLTEAWADQEWNATEPWNPPSSRTLAPGQSLTFGLRFSLAHDGIRALDEAVQRTGTPYARGIPGYILPQDLPAQLLVTPGAGGAVANWTVDPVDALIVTDTVTDTDTETAPGRRYTVTPSSSAGTFGRARLTLVYTSGQRQTVHYYLVPSGPAHLAALGTFLTTESYYTNTSDPFGRAPSIISYDYSVKAPVLQDARVWIAGLSDEGGAGSFLAAAMKQAAQPHADEMAKLEAFVDGVLVQTLQPGAATNNNTYAVRKSVFYYGLARYPYATSIDWTSWASWSEAEAHATDRAYDYVHVAATYWALYRAGRAYPALLTQHPWSWYLTQSYRTVMAAMAQDPATGAWLVDYATDGLMGETVVGALLTDLQRESLEQQDQQDEDLDYGEAARALEAKMAARAARWQTMANPFGSEMAWDSTGQEGVYYWAKYFGDTATANKTLGTVLGFQPTVAHWGWNGNARRYWDFLYAGKLERIERQLHHYGSGLNALVALSAFRSDPSDTYLVRIGYGGMNGPLANIHADGFAAAAFHSFPDTLAWDAYSGDYGPNHLGLILGTGTYLVEDAEVGGLVAYGGEVVVVDSSSGGGDVGGGNTTTTTKTITTIRPRDVARRKLFVGPLGLLVEIDAGVMEEVTYAPATASLALTLGQLAGVPTTNATVLWVSREEGEAGYRVTGATVAVTEARGGWAIPLSSESVVVHVVPS